MKKAKKNDDSSNEKLKGIQFRIISNLGDNKVRVSESDREDISKLIEETLKESNKGTYHETVLDSIPYAITSERMNNTFAVLAYDKAVDPPCLVACGFLNNWKSARAPEAEKPEWQVRGMYVRLAYQGRGIATKILRLLENEARNQKLNQLDLDAIHIQRTVQFYARNGYQEVSRGTRDVNGKGHYLTWTRMRKVF